jgi:hypothetical protein
VQIRHSGIKARGISNEKREEKPRLANTLLAAFKHFLKGEMRFLLADNERLMPFSTEQQRPGILNY